MWRLRTCPQDLAQAGRPGDVTWRKALTALWAAWDKSNQGAGS
jgi:hypothetical protein